MMKGLASLLLVAVLVCCGVEYGCSLGSPASLRFPLGAIGCLFTHRLCDPGHECVDDHLFGTCQKRGNVKDYYQYLLDRDTLEALEGQIWVLINKRYTWRDPYTQCVLQNILVSYRQETDFDKALCDSVSELRENTELTEDDISDVLQILFNYYENLRGRDPLKVGDSTSQEDYNPDYSSQKRDEFLKIHKYFDPSKPQWKRRVDDGAYPPPTFQDYLVQKEVENVLDDATRDTVDYDDLTQDDVAKLRLYLLALQEAAQISDNANNNNNNEDYSEENLSDSEYPTTEDINDLDSDDQGRDNGGAFWSSPGVEYTDSASSEEGSWHEGDKPLPGIDISILDTESQGNNVVSFPEQKEDVKAAEELLSKGEGLEESANEISESGLTPHYAKLLADLLQGDLDASKLSNEDLNKLMIIVNGLLNEYASEESDGANGDSQSDGPIMKDEVLDVPSVVETLSAEDMSSGENPAEESLMVKKADGPISYEEPAKDGGDSGKDPAVVEMTSTGPPTPALGVVDATYVYVTVDKDVDVEEGERLVDSLTRLMGVPPSSLAVTEVEDRRITFRISPELLQAYNATTIAEAAGAHKGDLARLTGLNIVSAGIGSQDGEVKIEVLGNKENSPKFFVLTFVLCGCIAGVLIAVVVIYLVKRHSRSRDKLAQLASEGIGAEASQDYQDLCRQRMQSKTSEKPEPLHAAGRIGSVSESQVRSPSSRSSTSSWSEEPVTSNMDISTGHIVLSYMEDHLKNKGRLDQEWEALGAYEADPCSTIVASDPSNTRKNRYGDNLPYDHSRVVLADSSNVSGSDYINASTITDHDPRNPAYISTQGPLPHTVADFWQMVWEQGSVVVVMLTKLTENGIAMCHRYWPEEGSDLYHIYEVHLVSEHIWCDDYLVRSFYLKNLQTNETRTVTQFHFLTWHDNKVPGSVKALLDFRRKVNKSYRGRSCPIVVHCSDGTGRSGTYTLIDMVLNRLAKGAKEIDIAATLEHIRDQRMGMVKTKEQFEFALAAVAEEVHAILKSLPQ